MEVALLLGDMTRADFSSSSWPERREWSWLPLSFPTPVVEPLPLGCRGQAAMFLHHRGNSSCCRWVAERFFFALPKTLRKCHRSGGRVGCLQLDQGHTVGAVKTPQPVRMCDKLYVCFLFFNTQTGDKRHERHVHMHEAFVPVVSLLKSRGCGTHHKAVIKHKSIPRITYFGFRWDFAVPQSDRAALWQASDQAGTPCALGAIYSVPAPNVLSHMPPSYPWSKKPKGWWLEQWVTKSRDWARSLFNCLILTRLCGCSAAEKPGLKWKCHSFLKSPWPRQG